MVRDSATAVAPPELARLLEVLTATQSRQIGPLAALAGELLHELATSAPDWGRVFLLQIDLFEASVAWLAFVNLCDLETRGAPVGSAREPLGRLGEGAKLSSGHWWSLLRESSRAVAESRDDACEPARIAASLYAGATRQGRGESPIKDKLDAVPNLRNRVKGHAWTLPPEQYAQHALGLLATTAAFLEALEGFTRCALVYVTRSTATAQGDAELDVWELRGDPRRPPRRPIRCSAALAPERVYLATASDLDVEQVGARAFLCLHPFVQWRRVPEGHEGLFIAQGLDEAGLDLASVIGGLRLVCKPSLGEARRRLDALLSRGREGVSNFDALHARAVEIARELLSSATSRASYDPRHYLVRPRIAQHLDETRRALTATARTDATTPARSPASPRLSLISGPSGSGKTALCCHAAERWLLSSRKDLLVVVARWSDLLAAGTEIETWWRQRFTPSLREACALAAEAGAVIQVYLDSVDRLPEIGGIVDQLLRLSRDPGLANLRLGVTATDGVAGVIARAFDASQLAHELHRWSVPSLSRAEALALYRLLGESEGEAPSKLSEEVLGFLQSPFLVRLARSLDTGEARGGITPGRLLRAHADRTLLADPIRAHLALRVVEVILASRRKVVPPTALLNDPELRPALLVTGEDAPLKVLVREQVLMLDRVQSTSRLPLPAETTLAFTFDAQLEYLVFLSLTRQHDPDLLHLAARLRDAPAFGPLVGGLRILAIETLHAEAYDAEALAAFVRALGQELQRAFVVEVLGAGLSAARAETFLVKVALPSLDTETLAECCKDAFQRLIVGGLLDEAFELAGLAGQHSGSAVVQQLLRRAVRMEAWSRDAVRAETRTRMLVAAAECHGLAARLAALDARAFVLEQQGARSARRAVDAEIRALSGEAPVDDPEARVGVLLAEARHCDEQQDPARDAWHDAALAAATGDRELACRTRLAIADLLASRHEPGHEACSQRLADEALALARELGDASLEARACSVVAHTLAGDDLAAAAWIEEGLLAAQTVGCRGSIARLLMRRARLHLGQARYDEAFADAREASREADLAGHREDAMRMRVHVQLVASWEMGRPGDMERLTAETRAMASALGAPFELALSHLLEARLACELGDRPRVRTALAAMHGQRTAHPEALRVHPEIVEGSHAMLTGDLDAALRCWEQAAAWGDAQRFADFVYQPRLLAARAWLQRARENPTTEASRVDREQVLLTLQNLLTEAPRQVGQLPRYEGEIAMLLAWALRELQRDPEAETWEGRAREWFTAHPKSLLAPEHHALLLRRGFVRDRAAATSVKEQATILRTLLGRSQKYVIEPVRGQAASFGDHANGAAYFSHHAAIARLRGLTPELDAALRPRGASAASSEAPAMSLGITTG